MSQELREALVEVGQETAVSTPDTNTVLLAFDKAGNAMKPITPQSIIPDGAVQKLESDVTVTVGTGGDYLTINAAIEALSKLKPTYISGGFTATINLLAGFIVAEQVHVVGVDLGWITITGTDAQTVVDISQLTVNELGGHALFYVTNGTLPVIAQLFTFSGIAPGGFNFILGYNSSVRVSTGGGAVNNNALGDYGVRLETCKAYMVGSIFNSFIKANVVSGTSTINLESANLNGGPVGVSCNWGAVINCDSAVSDATVGFKVLGGSILVADSAIGTLSQTQNTLTSEGIIYKG